jgi:hypothetical protein
MSIFIGLIDKDPIRLLTPILDKRSPCEHAIFIGDKNELDMFFRLHKVLNKNSVTSEFFEIPQEPSVALIKKSTLNLAQKVSTLDKPVYFNASCGLRHRLLSIYEIFFQFNWPTFVVEPFSDRLCWMCPEGRQSIFIQDHIKLEDYLSVFGADIERSNYQIDAKKQAQLIKTAESWANSAIDLGQGLATLNYLATKCRKENTLTVELSNVQTQYIELKKLITDLCEVNLANHQNGILTFKSEGARRFANGDWLELLVNYYINELSEQIPTIQDKALNLKVKRYVNGKEVRNEIDVATIVNNKLHLIDCKTKNMQSNGDDTLYKLESLKDRLGGFQARAMLISFRPLRYVDITRAKDLGLSLIGPDQLNQLPLHLKNWFNDAGGYEPSLI